jgi:hypothetical protein
MPRRAAVEAVAPRWSLPPQRRQSRRPGNCSEPVSGTRGAPAAAAAPGIVAGRGGGVSKCRRQSSGTRHTPDRSGDRGARRAPARRDLRDPARVARRRAAGRLASRGGRATPPPPPRRLRRRTHGPRRARALDGRRPGVPAGRRPQPRVGGRAMGPARQRRAADRRDRPRHHRAQAPRPAHPPLTRPSDRTRSPSTTAFRPRPPRGRCSTLPRSSSEDRSRRRSTRRRSAS